MAKAIETPANPEPQSEAPRPRSSILGKLLLLVFVLVVVGGECGVALVVANSFVASQSGAATTSKEGAGKEKPEKEKVKHKEGEKKEGEKTESDAEELEVDLGKFTVTSFQPKSNSTSVIDFHLFAIIAPADRNAFDASIEQNRNRLRDQVIVLVRGADLGELTEPGLGLLKRKILEKSNTILGKPFLRTIIFGDFSFMEQ